MARMIVVYATVEGQTHRIAERIASRIRAAGHEAVLVNANTVLTGFNEEGEYDAAILCGPVHQGQHPPDLVRVARENRETLDRMPAAFVSVSLAAAIQSAEHVEEAAGYVDRFTAETGWTPDEVHLAAGALRYSEMDYLKRLLMRMIADRRGGDTDTSRDYEYTDWATLDDFVDGFVRRVAPAGARAADD